MTAPSAMQPTSSASRADERAKFEKKLDLMGYSKSNLARDEHGNYNKEVLNFYWHIWQGALASQTIVPPVVQAPIDSPIQYDALINELAAIRDLFPIPPQSSPLEQSWAAAMGDPMEVSGFVAACLAAPIVATGETTVPSVDKFLWTYKVNLDLAKAFDARGNEITNGYSKEIILLVNAHNATIREIAAPSPTEQASDVRNAAPTVDIDQLVNRFLGWKLPQTFAPDCGISFKQIAPDSWPIGTNLFNAVEAMNMFSHCLDGVSVKAEQTASIEQRSYLQTKGIQDVEALELAAAIMTVVNGPWYPGGAVQIKAKIQEIILGNAALKSATTADKGNAPVGAKS